MNRSKYQLNTTSRSALIQEHLVEEQAELAEEIRHEYAGVVRRINDMADTMEDAFAFLSFGHHHGITCE